MAFIWNTNPNPPVREMPQAVPAGEITYEVHVIANSVDPKCTVTYNTANVGYDELCQLSSANISEAFFTDAYFDNFTANTANISTAFINVANIQTANILNANIRYGYVGSDPTSNLGIASKHYVDAAMANVPVGGSDLQNIIDAKGDLLVGIGPNTATRLPVGTDGQILISDSTSNTGLRWIDIAGQEQFFNLLIQTHYDIASNDHVVLLRSAGEIIMNDGTRTSGWVNQTADIEVSGAGGLDTGSESPSHWYEVHAIRNSSNGANNLLLHRASETTLDQSLTTTTDLGPALRKSTASSTKIAQSFIPDVAGPLTSAELEISRTGSPTGLIWVTIESDNVGNPSGTPLATSRVMDAARLPTDKARMRFLFDTNTTVSIGSTYHLVYQGDYALSDANYTTWWGQSVGGYANGSAKEFRTGAWGSCLSLTGNQDLWFKTFVQNTPITPVNLPSGYDQRCLISYVYNDANSRFKQYRQKTRSMVMGTSADWRAFTSNTGLVEAVDLIPFLPPVPCSVQFVSYTTIGTGNFDTQIGGVACTDMPNTPNTFSPGAVVANTRSFDTVNAVAQIGTALHEMLVVEDRVVLTRMHNTNCRLYVTQVTF